MGTPNRLSAVGLKIESLFYPFCFNVPFPAFPDLVIFLSPSSSTLALHEVSGQPHSEFISDVLCTIALTLGFVFRSVPGYMVFDI